MAMAFEKIQAEIIKKGASEEIRKEILDYIETKKKILKEYEARKEKIEERIKEIEKEPDEKFEIKTETADLIITKNKIRTEGLKRKLYFLEDRISDGKKKIGFLLKLYELAERERDEFDL